MIVNKFFTTEGKINVLLEILRTVPRHHQILREEPEVVRRTLPGRSEAVTIENNLPRHRHVTGRTRYRVHLRSLPFPGLPRQATPHIRAH